MKNKKDIIFDSLLLIAVLVFMFLIRKRIVFVMGAVIIACIGVDIYGKFKGQTDEEINESDDGSISDDEEQLIEDGEYSYDNYDEVCCPKCGAYLGKGVTVCKQCGWGESEYPAVCPNCGKPNEDNLPFCAYCNYQFKKNTTKEDLAKDNGKNDLKQEIENTEDINISDETEYDDTDYYVENNDNETYVNDEETDDRDDNE